MAKKVNIYITCLNLVCIIYTLIWIIFAGHEDATEDFGIYEFVSVPEKMDSTQVEMITLLFCMGSFSPEQLIISSLCFPGILQVFGTARFSQRFAYHHLWCHQTCAWNSDTESFEMREVDSHVCSDVKMKCILLICFCAIFLSHTFKHI